ncbi:MAG: rod shape-determining protein MreC [Flavobacteriales bacterium]
MRNIIAFVQKNSNFFLFLLLQGFCFALIFSENRYQRAVFVNSSNALIANILELRSGLTAYINLRQQNIDLSEENAQLKEMMKGYTLHEEKGFLKKNDSVLKQQFTFIPAEIINSTWRNRANFLTLNRGKSSGIEEGMGIVGPNGIIGYIRDVSENFSTAYPVIHERTEIGVIHEPTGTFGLLKWTTENNHTEATVTAIAGYVKINIGDVILTRGDDALFPKGERVGEVTAVYTEPGINYHTITIRLFTDFQKCRHCYIIKNIYKLEQLDIEKKAREQ